MCASNQAFVGERFVHVVLLGHRRRQVVHPRHADEPGRLGRPRLLDHRVHASAASAGDRGGTRASAHARHNVDGATTSTAVSRARPPAGRRRCRAPPGTQLRRSRHRPSGHRARAGTPRGRRRRSASSIGAREPVAVLDDRDASRSRAPRPFGELARGRPSRWCRRSARRARAGRGGRGARRARSARCRDLVGVVLLREEHREPRRLDAALGGEAHEARVGVVVGRRAHHEHRVLEVVDDAVERGSGRRITSAALPRSARRETHTSSTRSSMSSSK